MKLQALGFSARLFHHHRHAVVFGRGQAFIGKSHAQPNGLALGILAAIGGKHDIARPSASFERQR